MIIASDEIRDRRDDRGRVVESIVAVLSQSCIVGQEVDGEFDNSWRRWLVEVENLLS